MVGASPKWTRPSHFVMKYLQDKGYRVIPVNPAHPGLIINGEPTHPSLKHVCGPFQMVDIFRNSTAATDVVDDTLRVARRHGIDSVWMQLGVINKDAAQRAEDAGLDVIMDKCPKIEYARLFGDQKLTDIRS